MSDDARWCVLGLSLAVSLAAAVVSLVALRRQREADDLFRRVVGWHLPRPFLPPGGEAGATEGGGR
jgi:hypothetical protein